MKIRKGAKISLVAPSSKIDPSEVELIKNYIESLGFKPKMSTYVQSEELFYSNTAENRAKDFKDALLDEETDIIWAIRGGRGALELLNYFEDKVVDHKDLALPDKLPAEKLLIGFSDITTLHAYLIKKYGLVTLHAEVLSRIVFKEVDESSLQKLERLLTVNDQEPLIYELTKISTSSSVDGGTDNSFPKMKGKIFGGNMTLVEEQVGSYYQQKYEPGGFLLLEDIDSAPTQIERSITHMTDSGTLDNIKAVIFGDFTTDDKEYEDYMEWAQYRFAEKAKKIEFLDPDLEIFIICGVGHGKVNNPIFLNHEAEIYKEDDRYYIKIANPIEIVEV